MGKPLFQDAPPHRPWKHIKQREKMEILKSCLTSLKYFTSTQPKPLLQFKDSPHFNTYTPQKKHPEKEGKKEINHTNSS